MTTQTLLLGLYQHVVSLAASTCLTHAFRRAFEDDVLLFQVCPHRGIYLRKKKNILQALRRRLQLYVYVISETKLYKRITDLIFLQTVSYNVKTTFSSPRGNSHEATWFRPAKFSPVNTAM